MRLQAACLLIVVLGFGSIAAAEFPQKTVVLLNGLPGDVENERADEQILSDLLGSLNSGPEGKLVVLSEAKVNVPTGLRIERRVPNRENFLALAGELKGQKATVFVWGHGGMIGSKPVFHLRGPRLSPEDFKAIGDALDCEWVLMFCGSGSFAQVLEGGNRRVLASEAETRFSSDPIGMRLVGRSLAGAAGLEELGRRVGKATWDYYEERHLARNEEPALWLENRKPEKLAIAESVVTALTPGGESGGGEWTRIARVRAEDYPGEDGVILQRRLVYVLGEATALSEEHEEIIQVLTVEGKHLGDFDISYSPPEESLEFEACEVLSPDGKVERVSTDSIREVNQKEWAEYGTPSRKIFSLPGVVPGSLIHVRYRQSWKHFPLPQVSLEIGLSAGQPILTTEIEVRVAAKSAFHFSLRGIEGPDPKIEVQDYSQVYRWKFPLLGALRGEPLVAGASEPALLISTWPDWKAFSAWYRRLIKLADAATPELEAKAQELVVGKTTNLEKAEALYNFVTKLRYVAVPMGVNSHRPHAAANVLKNAYGDCKDKANLFNTLLRAVGIEADLVLVPRFSQASPATPGLAFNHAISRFKVDGKVLWADTTDDVCRFGLLPPGDPGRNVLVINEATTALTALPPGQALEHYLKIEQRVDLRGNPAPSELSATTKGFFDYESRAASRAVGRNGVPVLWPLVQARVGKFKLDRQQSTQLDALERPFEWTASGEYFDLLTTLPGQGGRILQAPILIPAEWEQIVQKRRRPLFLNQGYPGMIEQKLELRLPPLKGTVVLPNAAGCKAGPLNWQIEWKQAAADRLEVFCRVSWPNGELDSAQTEEFQAEWVRMRAALLIPAVLVGQ